MALDVGTVPQNVYFYFIPVIPVNEPQNYILVIEKLGSNKVTVEVATPNYFFASFPFSEKDTAIFRKISKKDLLVIAGKMKLRNLNFPHAIVYYAIFNKVISVSGSQSYSQTLRSWNCDNFIENCIVDYCVRKV